MMRRQRPNVMVWATNLPPDYATSVRNGGFYGWPWFYIGANSDPRHQGIAARPVIVPDVLIQPHSAPLGIAFYDRTAFPAEYRGDAFVALHGSWNRSTRTGYKVIRLRFVNGRPTGEYEDFLTGFGRSDRSVWGRPVGVAVAADGALLVSEDGNGTIWRIAYKGRPAMSSPTQSPATTGPGTDLRLPLPHFRAVRQISAQCRTHLRSAAGVGAGLSRHGGKAWHPAHGRGAGEASPAPTTQSPWMPNTGLASTELAPWRW